MCAGRRVACGPMVRPRPSGHGRGTEPGAGLAGREGAKETQDGEGVLDGLEGYERSVSFIQSLLPEPGLAGRDLSGFEGFQALG
jgi:hypothetical protein